MNRLNTSEGTPKPATWPMWRGPLAYGQATAERTWVMRGILVTRRHPVSPRRRDYRGRHDHADRRGPAAPAAGRRQGDARGEQQRPAAARRSAPGRAGAGGAGRGGREDEHVELGQGPGLRRTPARGPAAG